MLDAVNVPDAETTARGQSEEYAEQWWDEQAHAGDVAIVEETGFDVDSELDDGPPRAVET